jgi:hypothetical protein
MGRADVRTQDHRKRSDPDTGGAIVWVGHLIGSAAELDAHYDTFDCVGRPGRFAGIRRQPHPSDFWRHASMNTIALPGRTYRGCGHWRGHSRQCRQLRAAVQPAHGSPNVVSSSFWRTATTIEAKNGYGLNLEDEIKIPGSRGSSQPQPSKPADVSWPHDVRTNIATHGKYVRRIIEEMIPRVVQEGLALFCDVFCDVGYFSLEDTRAILQAAKAAGLGLRVHADQLARSGGARLAAELGAMSADHLEWIDDEDIEALRKAGTIATLVRGDVQSGTHPVCRREN